MGRGPGHVTFLNMAPVVHLEWVKIGKQTGRVDYGRIRMVDCLQIGRVQGHVTSLNFLK